MVYRTPKKHHLDCCADQLLGKGLGEPDDLLSSTDVASWLGVSAQWLEIGRSSGKYGPPNTAPHTYLLHRGASATGVRMFSHGCESAHVRTLLSTPPIGRSL